MSWSVSIAAGGPIATATVSPIAYTWAGTAGRLYVLCVGRDAATATTTTVTDSASNTWTMVNFAAASGSVGRHIEQWYCVPAAPFTSVTITFANANATGAIPLEITGQATSGLINAQNANFAAASLTPAEVQVTPSVAGTLEISAIQWNSNNHSTAVSAEAGWTKLTALSGGPAVAYRTTATSGVADGCAWTTTGSSAGSATSIVAYAAGVAAGPAVTVWNGTTEVAAAVTYWNGTTEVAATVEQVT